MNKRLVKSLVTVIAVVIMMANSMVAFAAPKTMPDGTSFDAEYYANSNPDVVAAVGKSETALYKHYVEYGKKEGRLATKDAGMAKIEKNLVRERSKLSQITNTETNAAVARGEYTVDLFGMKTTSGTLSSGVYWECSYYRPYIAAWDSIYDASCGDKWAIENLKNGEILSELFNDNIGKGGAEMFMDYGFFVEYIDQFKRRGVVPQNYQLPEQYYSISKAGGSYKSGVATRYYISTDCPEATNLYNSMLNRENHKNLPYQEIKTYTPKYLRDQVQ